MNWLKYNSFYCECKYFILRWFLKIVCSLNFKINLHFIGNVSVFKLLFDLCAFPTVYPTWTIDLVNYAKVGNNNFFSQTVRRTVKKYIRSNRNVIVMNSCSIKWHKVDICQYL